MAAEGVVLPMPMSPVPTMSSPAAISRLDHLDAGLAGPDGLLAASWPARAAMLPVPGAILLVDQRLGVGRQVGRHAHVHHDDARADVPGQHVDGRPAAQEVVAPSAG